MGWGEHVASASSARVHSEDPPWGSGQPLRVLGTLDHIAATPGTEKTSPLLIRKSSVECDFTGPQYAVQDPLHKDVLEIWN